MKADKNKYVVVSCHKNLTLYYVDNFNYEIFSLELLYANKFIDFNNAIKKAEHLTKKYNINFNVLEV